MKSKKWIIVVAAVALSGASCETMKKGLAKVDAALKQANEQNQAQARAEELRIQGTEPNARTMAAINRINNIYGQYFQIWAGLHSYWNAEAEASKVWALIPPMRAAIKELRDSVRANPTSAKRADYVFRNTISARGGDWRLNAVIEANAHFYNSPRFRQAHSDFQSATKAASYQ